MNKIIELLTRPTDNLIIEVIELPIENKDKDKNKNLYGITTYFNSTKLFGHYGYSLKFIESYASNLIKNLKVESEENIIRYQLLSNEDDKTKFNLYKKLEIIFVS
jgi:hypothetical protein